MRHLKAGRKIGHSREQGRAILKNLSISLIESKSLVTTLPRAKELRRYLEPLITKSKIDSVANRRYIFNIIRNKKATQELFNAIGPVSKERNGGYLRVLKCGYRAGDNAPLGYVELVDRE